MIVVGVAALVFAGYAAVSAATRDDGPDYASTYTAPPAAQYDRASVSFLGDSYTVGVGATTESLGYAHLLGKRQCWSTNIVAQSSTGYLNPGVEDTPEPFTAQDRIEAVASVDPELVIVQGSINDGPKPELYTAATSLYASLKTAAPSARIVVLGPTVPPMDDTGNAVGVRDVLARAAAESGLDFIDPIALDWMTPEDYASDRQHPNTDGHAKLATKLRDQLATLNLPRFDTCAPVS